MQESTLPTQCLMKQVQKTDRRDLKERSAQRTLKMIFQMTFFKEINTYLEHVSEGRSQLPRPLRIFKLSESPSHLHSTCSSKCSENTPESCRLGTETTISFDGLQKEASSPDLEMSVGPETPISISCKSSGTQTVFLFL